MREAILHDLMLHKAHISDAAPLVRSGVLSGSVKSAEEYLRDSASHSDIKLYTADAFLAKVIITSNCGADIELTYPDDISVDLLTKLLDELCRIVFFKYGLHKVTIKVPCTDLKLDEAVMNNGFIQTAILMDEFKTSSGYMDGGLYSLPRAQYRGYNVCFVPFQRGIAVVGGTDTYVDTITFLSYEATIEDDFVAQAAWQLGITDDDGILLPRGSACYEISFAEEEYLPAEVVRAGVQLREFFLKKRDTFDINVLLYGATDFQLKVWEQLRKIPYGMTVSYEDVALKITDGDIKSARKITRAVGSACSENPVPILIPCHRVIGKNGMLVGFSGGIEFKDFLLNNEMFSSAMMLN